MRRVFLVLLCVLSLPLAAYLAWAQADHQVDDKGYIDIGSYTETAAKKRPIGSLYRGAGVLVYEGKPPKPYIQHDMVGYEVDPVPASERNRPYNKHDLAARATWQGLDAGAFGGGEGRVPPMTAAGYAAFETSIVMGGPRGNLSLTQQVNDPELICDPVGYPRSVVPARGPTEFFQFPSETLIHHVWHETWMKIWTDGRLLPKSPIDPAFVGYSVGKWVDGPTADTFVIDTNGVDDRTWINGGLRHSFAATFQARFRRIEYAFLQENVTINDPAYYTETWNLPTILYEMYPNTEADIWPCVPSDELFYRENSPTELPKAGAK